MMKIYIAGLATETNTFSPLPTGLADFDVVRGHDLPQDEGGLLPIMCQLAESRGWDLRIGLFADAEPASITVRAAYESLRDEILTDLRDALPVDMVILFLHGAMIAQGYDDCEGDLLARVRQVVGPNVPVGALLDPHCHLTEAMTENATALIAFKEYPHTDFAERAEELFDLVGAAAAGQVKPATSVYDCRMIGVYHTNREPMRSYVDRLQALEGRDGVLSISVAHGFPWGDVPDMGTRVWVITDDRRAYGDQLAERLGRELIEMREALRPDYLSLAQGLNRVLAANESPVVIADVSDNAGGGAPGDSTFILRALLEQGITNVALACIWDPVAVSIVLNTNRMQTFGPDTFTNLGINPQERRLLVVKSSQHFYARFAPIAAEILYVAAPGAVNPDITQLPFQHARQDIWIFSHATG